MFMRAYLSAVSYYIFLSIYLFIYLSIYLFIYLSICLSVYLYIYLSIRGVVNSMDVHVYTPVYFAMQHFTSITI